ncbi:hypothetical protein Cgig2_021078 [Carnegiea gigantea]|uniref:Dynein light chain 1, cytoplasmic n=1 Tax=Carnegiea gigantea TaxID=171969 RepID=A0A9Q1GHK9_9CARY|nr:hypothetical protein Cgig2_021078 [Carnegiea gigantea]
MSDDSKKGPPGALAGKPSSDDRKSSPASSGKRVVIKSADMSDDMQKEAVDTAIAAFEKHSVEKDVAERIKKEFDKKYGATWHCIVGRNFDSSQFQEEELAQVFGIGIKIGNGPYWKQVHSIRTTLRTGPMGPQFSGIGIWQPNGTFCSGLRAWEGEGVRVLVQPWDLKDKEPRIAKSACALE